MFYAEYIKESFGRSIIETDDGFVTYKVIETVCHIDTMYIKPDARNKGLAQKLLAQVIEAALKEAPIDLVVCEVDPLSSTCSETVQKFLHYGFKILDCHREQVRMYLRVGGL